PQSYLKPPQNTLYKIRSNPPHPPTHQYPTHINSPNLNPQLIKPFYHKIPQIPKYFQIPQYNK
ncbi:hypothetical protein, partial [Staphylococcus capitis]|uniref:hypothetical protein n=1 Tax=Staphylococcus capitis TaxID=29388 RepID=UPI001C9317EA